MTEVVPVADDVRMAELLPSLVLSVPGVAGLRGGQYGEVATYLPGRRLVGVRRRGEAWEVHIAIWWDAESFETGDRVRHAVHAVTGGPVDVVIDDVVVPEEDQEI